MDLNLQNEIAQQQPDFQVAAHLKPSYQGGWTKTDKISQNMSRVNSMPTNASVILARRIQRQHLQTAMPPRPEEPKNFGLVVNKSGAHLCSAMVQPKEMQIRKSTSTLQQENRSR